MLCKGLQPGVFHSPARELGRIRMFRRFSLLRTSRADSHLVCAGVHLQPGPWCNQFFIARLYLRGCFARDRRALSTLSFVFFSSALSQSNWVVLHRLGAFAGTARRGCHFGFFYQLCRSGLCCVLVFGFGHASSARYCCVASNR